MHPCATPHGENAWKFASGFSWTLPHAPFPFADLNLSSFALINLRIRGKKKKRQDTGHSTQAISQECVCST